MFQLPAQLPLKFTSSKGPFQKILSPNDGKSLLEVQFATNDDIKLILDSALEAQAQMAKLHPYERAEILKKVAADLKEKIDFMAWVIASEGGKPLKDAKVEASRAVATLELCAEETLRLEGEMIPMERTAAGKDHIAFTMRDPIGPVLAISAFNHPLNLIAHQVGCAVASGCAVVLKPASSTPICAFFLEEAFLKAGLPKSGLRVINAEVELTEKLVESKIFNYVSFIGSAKVGWEMRKKIAPGTRIAMEHGGQAPAIVRADADLTAAVKALIKGAFYHAGQVCISTQRIFVHEKVFETFLKDFKAQALELKVGVATDVNTDVGPLIKLAEVVRIQKWIDEAVKAGAKIETGNKVTGQFMTPTILTNVSRDVALMKDPYGKWSPETGDRHLEIAFHDLEWRSFFFRRVESRDY